MFDSFDVPTDAQKDASKKSSQPSVTKMSAADFDRLGQVDIPLSSGPAF